MAGDAAHYMLIFRETTPEVYEEMTREQKREHLDRWNVWCDDLAAQGKLQQGHPLAPEGRVISSGRDRRPVDGPYAEAKELVGGYFIIAAAGLEEATRVAEQCPLLPFGMTVEVRPVAGGCHLARALGWDTMREPAAQ